MLSILLLHFQPIIDFHLQNRCRLHGQFSASAFNSIYIINLHPQIHCLISFFIADFFYKPASNFIINFTSFHIHNLTFPPQN